MAYKYSNACALGGTSSVTFRR